MRLRTRSLEVFVSSVAMVSACGAAPPETAQPAVPVSEVKSTLPATTSAPEVVIERARGALRAAALPADAKLVSNEPAQWNDSSLGCAQPGMQYLQVITSGYVLRFVERGYTHEVHVAGEAAVVCAPSLAGVPRRPGQAYRARDLESLIERARADLATRLNKPVGEVELTDVLQVTWPDGSLGCNLPRSGRDAPLPGYKIWLIAAGEPYVYHTDVNAVFACPPIERD